MLWTMTSSKDRVDGKRLWSRLMAMAEIGATPAGGSNRQALSDDDAAGRELFVGWAEQAGCTVSMDRIGNLFVRRRGTDPDAPPVMTGSHLDTQPTGGRFDGVYGVLGGLEVIERMNDLGLRTRCPIEVVVWTNEEGSRFPRSMMGSGVWAGVSNLEATYELCDLDGVCVGDELERLGWVGELPAAPQELTGYIELHIEQGPILESAGVEIGAVNSVQGLRWYDLTIHGFPAHAGPTPMAVRKDPAKAIAQIINGVYVAADDLGPAARATFAMFRSEPSSPNTIPETLRCTLDLRHPDLEVLDELEARMRAVADAACAAFGVTVDIDLGNDSPPVAFDPACVTAVETAAESLGMSWMPMVSGAGHDACYVAGVAPTAMIFVPCEGGLSHNEAEAITPEEAERGASVLFGAMCALAGIEPQETI